MSEAKLKHRLWNFLEGQGYRVGGEVKVVPDEKVKSIRKEKLKGLPPLELYGLSTPRAWKRVSYRIDIVAFDGKEYIGYEVKSRFEDISSGYFWDQMESYANGEMLDRLFLVFHDGECIHGKHGKEYEHILSSYKHALREAGIGLIVLEGNDFTVKLEARKLNRVYTPKLERNETWLRHKVWNYFESQGFEVEGEVKILERNVRIAKGRIDLALLPKGVDLAKVTREQNKYDHIGVEVKYRVRRSELSKVINQLNSYVYSGCFTKVYLLVRERDLWIVDEIKKKVTDRRFGVMVFFQDEEVVKECLEAPKLNMRSNAMNFISYV